MMNERAEQALVASYLRANNIQVIVTLGGIKLSESQKRLYKQAGYQPGTPDLFIPYARGKFHGLAIEMKKKKGGTVSDVQKDYLKNLEKEGYKIVIARGASDALQYIQSYLGGVK